LPKNLTISISDELAEKIDMMPEINWSEVCRQAISKYIDEKKIKEKGEPVKELELKVGDANQRDVARGISRINQKTMEKIGVPAGDIIEIVGKRKTSSIAWPAYSEDQNKTIIRMDSFTRKNAGVSVNEVVTVRRAEVKNAASIVLAPVDIRINVDEDFTNFVKNRLMERTFVEGDTLVVKMLGHPVQFAVMNTRPHGVVRITYDTKLQILNEPLPSPALPVQVELTSINELNNLNAEIEILEKGYDIINKNIELKVAIIVKFYNSVQTNVFDTYLDESTNLSDLLNVYRRKALNEIEIVKTDMKKRFEQVGFPINISLSDIGKVIAEKIMGQH